MGILSWTDGPTILLIMAAVLVPELIRGFSRRAGLSKVAILLAFCCLATVTAHLFQHQDVGSAFTRAFLIAMVARLNLLLNHIAEAVLAAMKGRQKP